MCRLIPPRPKLYKLSFIALSHYFLPLWYLKGLVKTSVICNWLFPWKGISCKNLSNPDLFYLWYLKAFWTEHLCCNDLTPGLLNVQMQLPLPLNPLWFYPPENSPCVLIKIYIEITGSRFGFLHHCAVKGDPIEYSNSEIYFQSAFIYILN